MKTIALLSLVALLAAPARAERRIKVGLVQGGEFRQALLDFGVQKVLDVDCRLTGCEAVLPDDDLTDISPVIAAYKCRKDCPPALWASLAATLAPEMDALEAQIDDGTITDVGLRRYFLLVRKLKKIRGEK